MANKKINGKQCKTINVPKPQLKYNTENTVKRD